MKKKRNSRISVGGIIGRFFISIGLVLLMLVLMVYTLAFEIAHGPSETMRDTLVNMAMQASATKWAPGLVLSGETVEKILNESKTANVEVIDAVKLDEVERVRIDEEGQHIEPVTTAEPTVDTPEPDVDWSKAIDGIIFKVVEAPHCRAYIAVIQDPSRVYTAAASDFQSGKAGARFWDMADREGAVLMINAGEYPDSGGGGNGSIPIGITYSKGSCVYNDNRSRTFIGFDKDNKMVLREGITRAKADSLGVRDGVCFQYNNILIYQDDSGNVVANRRSDTAMSQRTAIGQREDGAVIMIVTDGRTGASLGASYNDMIDLMLRFGAVNAGMLDGGSSSMLYYRDYYNIYDYDVSTLDKYQKMGLVNVFKAFTEPRRIPTYFAVAPLTSE